MEGICYSPEMAYTYGMGTMGCYFLLLGMVVLIESKFLGLLNISIGVSKSCWKGLYQFMLDMLKLVFKSSVSLCLNLQLLGYYLVLLVVQGGTVITFLMLPFGLGSFMSYGFIWFLMISMMVSILKLVLVNGFSSPFLKLLSVSMGETSLLLEMLLISSYMFFMSLYTGLGMCFWKESFNMFSLGSMFGVAPFSTILLMTLLLKASSMPFDYMEAESEFVGGVGLEFHGMFFTIWTSVEYGTLINSSLLLGICTFGMFLDYSKFFVPMVMGSVLVMIASSGFLVSFQVKSMCGMLVSLFLTLSIILFMFLILFIVSAYM